MTVPLIIGIVAAWLVLALLLLVVLTRAVGRADEENEVSSMRRIMRANDEVQTPPSPAREPWQPAPDSDGISTRRHS